MGGVFVHAALHASGAGMRVRFRGIRHNWGRNPRLSCNLNAPLESRSLNLELFLKLGECSFELPLFARVLVCFQELRTSRGRLVFSQSI